MITRHNYEEFFLMYVDDELTAQERVAVNLFIQQNPDLAEELEMLQQTKLIADESLQFEDKKMLLQNVDEIGIDNYEEQFLLYIDKELDVKNANDVEKFVLQHPQFQDEFTLLKQTVLEPEQIVFENKETLLRKEERRVVPMFIRYAAAAAVVGIAITLWFVKSNSASVDQPNVAKNTKPNATKENVAPVPGSNTVTKPKKNDEHVVEDIAATPEENKQQQEETASVKQKTENKEQQKESPVKVQQNNVQPGEIAANKIKNPVNAPVVGTIDVNHDQETISKPAVVDNSNTTDYAKNDNNVQHDNFAGVHVVNSNDAKDNYIQPAVYKELNTEEEDAKSALYVGSLQINKNKVRGLVKKVGGLFAGRSKDAAKEDGKLQIANLELNTN